MEEASPGVGRHPPTSPAQVNSQQAPHPPIAAAPTFSWAPQPYRRRQPGPTSNHPPSHLQGNQSFAAPQDGGDKTRPKGISKFAATHPRVAFVSGRDESRLRPLDL